MRRYLIRFLQFALLFSVTVVITLFLNKILQVLLPVYDETDAVATTDVKRDIPVAAAVRRLRLHSRSNSDRLESGLRLQREFYGKHPRDIGDRKIDWSDYEFLAAERARTGIGEHGEAAAVPPSLQHERKVHYDENGFDGLLSDMISLNRSVKDIRHKE